MIELNLVKTNTDFKEILKKYFDKNNMIILKNGNIKTYLKEKEYILNGHGLINYSAFKILKISEVNINEAYILSFDGVENSIFLAEAFLLLCPITGVFQMSLDLEQFEKIEKILDLMREKTESAEIVLFQTLLIIKYLYSFMNEKNIVKIVDHPIVKEFVEEINKNFTISHKVRYYAEKLSINTRTLNRIFKENIGITPKQSLNYRIDAEAKKNLINKNKSIKEIAYGLGFRSPEYFDSFFRTMNRISPAAYVKEVSYNISFLS